MHKQSTSMYHNGHRELQDKFDGRRMADALEKHRQFSKFREEDVQFMKLLNSFLSRLHMVKVSTALFEVVRLVLYV